MNLFKVTVCDYFFGVELSGEFEAESAEEAEAIAREFYAHDLGTTPEEIDVVDVREVQETKKEGTPTTAYPQTKNKTLHHEEELHAIMPQDAAAVNPGRIYASESIYDAVRKNTCFLDDLSQAMEKFVSGDWGECFDSDADFNDLALDAGTEKIIGVYDTAAGRVWVMAEPWAETTTVLFEHEY